MKNKFTNPVVLLIMLMAISNSIRANTYTVTSTADATTSGTLRWAITQANANAGYDVINFNIGSTGNTFENDGAGNSWAVITLTSALPILTETVLIDGTTQSNANVGFKSGRTVGVDGIVQGNINYPDVYIVQGYTGKGNKTSYLPADANGTDGNGLSVNAPGITIKGLAISGFGNTSTSQPTAIGHADISILYSSAARTMNTVISDCFLSCDPRGNVPSTTTRQTLGSGLLILGNNNYGTATRNYISHSGAYGIIFHASQTNTTTSASLSPATNWTIEENQVIDIGTSTIITGSRAADGISLLASKFSVVRNNYVADWEQFGIDLGHNADDNRVENNTLTGFTKTIGSSPCGGVRTAFSSERDVVSKNVIFNNTSTLFLGGIYTDESQTSSQSFAGAVVKDNKTFQYVMNSIHNNINSGIVLSTNGAGAVTEATISQNSIYENTGLGIDLGFSDLTGPTLVTGNDNGDPDTGPNNLQNFPMIDGASLSSTNVLTVWGKAPAGSTIEFFTSDGQRNNFVNLGLDYGEGKNYLGTGIEGSAADGAIGTGSYNVDGNVAVNNANLFKFSFSVTGVVVNVDKLTSTATLAGNTSEFGPIVPILQPLDITLNSFTGKKNNNDVILNWEAVCDKQFNYFTVEYSANGTDFTTLKKVVPAIGYAGVQKFSFTHSAPLATSKYYRLKMVDQDARFKYSNVLLFKEALVDYNNLKVFPNPVQSQLAIQLPGRPDESSQIIITDPQGRTVYHSATNTSAATVINVNTQSWPAQTYILKVMNRKGEVLATQKIVKL